MVEETGSTFQTAPITWHDLPRRDVSCGWLAKGTWSVNLGRHSRIPMNAKDPIETILEHLRKDVSDCAGFDVTCTRDCEVLSDELKAFDGRFPVSVSTLRRFFRLIPSKSAFSNTTLNSLARYVGYKSYAAWKDKAQSTEKGPSMPLEFPQELQAPTHDGLLGTPADWSAKESEQRIRQFIQAYANPEHFHLNPAQFDKLKDAMFAVYQRGTLDMNLWMEFNQHIHLKEFITEQFPPLDFMNSFGQAFMEEYLRTTSSPLKEQFALGVIASGKLARGLAWSNVLDGLPQIHEANPNMHPLVCARNMGIWALGLSESPGQEGRYETYKTFVLDVLERSNEIWPRWSNQACYLAFNLSDWATLSGDFKLVSACATHIEAFRAKQDWYHRSKDIEHVLDIRMTWHHLLLGDWHKAKVLLAALPWESFVSMESRTLSIWYHAAHLVLGIGNHRMHRNSFNHFVAMTGYRGFGRRIESIMQALIESKTK